MDLMQALAVIDRVADNADTSQERGQDLINALAFLQSWGINREDLVWFWKLLEGDNPIGRFQSANGCRNRIKYLVNEQRRAMKERRNPSHGDW